VFFGECSHAHAPPAVALQLLQHVRLVVRVTWWACMGRDGGTCGVVECFKRLKGIFFRFFG
jgi:hypothetical protein